MDTPMLQVGKAGEKKPHITQQGSVRTWMKMKNSFCITFQYLTLKY